MSDMPARFGGSCGAAASFFSLSLAAIHQLS
jgi:hypothetical protein